MFVWTPAERRGVWVVLLLLAIGTAHDLTRARSRTPLPVRDGPVDPAGTLAPPPALDSSGIAGPAQPVTVPGGAAAPAARVDLNHASVAALDALPGIGPVLAGRIVAHRQAHGPYREVEDLLDVPGIGPTLLERLRPLVDAGR